MSAKSMLTLSLTSDEALVLFEWLSREDAKRSIPIEHEAEQKVLWGIEAQLEHALTAPLEADYAAEVARARERIISPGGDRS